MSDVIQILKALADTPLPSMFIVAGIVFLFLSFAEVINIYVPPEHRPWLRILGGGFITAGILLFIVSRGSPPSTPATSQAFLANATATTSAISTATLTSTSTPLPTSTSTPTLSPTSTATNTPTPTATDTPIVCPFQGKNDLETLATLVNAEAVAVNDRNGDFIRLIFAPNAVIRDRQNDQDPSQTNKVWSSPDARYLKDLFVHTTIRGATHSDIVTVGQGITLTRAWLVSGSAGEWLDGSTWRSYTNPSKLNSAFGSDHWTFAKNNVGCWVIVQYDFDASHIAFPP